MNRRTELINTRYEAMMFARSSDEARKAARELVRVILGDEGMKLPLEEALRDCCRVMRPSVDPREQQRFESEFIELGIWPGAAGRIAA